MIMLGRLEAHQLNRVASTMSHACANQSAQESGEYMADKSSSNTCSLKCETSYNDCMRSREHESVCRLKFAQCHCGCSSS